MKQDRLQQWVKHEKKLRAKRRNQRRRKNNAIRNCILEIVI